MVNATIGFENATSHSLEKWKGMTLARIEDKRLAILLKFLINLL